MSEALVRTLRAHGGLLAELGERLQGDGAEPRCMPRGPRIAGREAEYALLLELVFEGVRLHYEPPIEDRELALLLGDRLYALGLERLAALGDVEAVQELADTISLIAQAHATGDEELAAAAWEAGTAAIACGSTPRHEAAKELARSGRPGAAPMLRKAASRGS